MPRPPLARLANLTPLPVPPLHLLPVADAEGTEAPPSEIVPIRRERTRNKIFSLRSLQGVASRMFPHQVPHLICPPGPIPTGPLPPVIVSSLMRSGTHLAIDLLLNNLDGYRQDPLYVDYDSFAHEGFSPQALLGCGSTLIKTHIAQRPFAASCQGTLLELGRRGLVIIPVRDPLRIQSSMLRWGYRITESALAAQHTMQLAFWKDHDPITVPFEDLLNPAAAAALLATVRQRLGLPPVPQDWLPLIADGSRTRNLWQKLRTRVQASRAPIINTSVGFKL